METDENGDLEVRAMNFLVSAAVGRKSFPEAFNGAAFDIQGLLESRGYVSRGNITSLGRSSAADYATNCSPA